METKTTPKSGSDSQRRAQQTDFPLLLPSPFIAMQAAAAAVAGRDLPAPSTQTAAAQLPLFFPHIAFFPPGPRQDASTKTTSPTDMFRVVSSMVGPSFTAPLAISSPTQVARKVQPKAPQQEKKKDKQATAQAPVAAASSAVSSETKKRRVSKAKEKEKQKEKDKEASYEDDFPDTTIVSFLLLSSSCSCSRAFAPKVRLVSVGMPPACTSSSVTNSSFPPCFAAETDSSGHPTVRVALFPDHVIAERKREEKARLEAEALEEESRQALELMYRGRGVDPFAQSLMGPGDGRGKRGRGQDDWRDWGSVRSGSGGSEWGMAGFSPMDVFCMSSRAPILCYPEGAEHMQADGTTPMQAGGTTTQQQQTTTKGPRGSPKKLCILFLQGLCLIGQKLLKVLHSLVGRISVLV
uniref:Uncharacterized protein n=1 Tax=Chromera velia CCMP2878 TaxID=1169474 RepID=A0A0G4I3H1_9ALVE|eukprot:Cvel_10625.t1-p1 / transcript=Cvel_10625.t1 / gene=Cvel_10625 / organism=Chromera_velia_CCMP2878 / gene_product=hypothetical protein / transcript_product=hypothetical protein / location=Cvel_scaffold645:25901-30683(+) / protein_length=407 / sequence_SO=supercontig / SO=protein_coding / is_pseudo=false